ncbi:putative retinoblastoma-like protein 1 isoform a, partial [Operophtera brumata]
MNLQSGRACPDTPLTGRRYLARRGEELTPVSEAKNSLSRLAVECCVSEEAVNTFLIKPCNGWMGKFAQALREASGNPSSETTSFRCNMVTCLYYKMLLSQQTYQLAIYACCTEVVLHAYVIHSLKFPRVLQIYGLSAFHFYKVIELVLSKTPVPASADVYVHESPLRRTNSKFDLKEVLESLVWTSDSPLWEQLSKTPVPASADVYVHESPLRRINNSPLWEQLSKTPVPASADVYVHESPLRRINKVLESLVWTSDSPLWEQLSKTPVPASADVYVHESPLRTTNSKFDLKEVLESLVWTSDSPLWEQLSRTPVPASADVYSPVSVPFDRFLPPMADQAKKQLFKDPIKPGQSLLVCTNNMKQEPSTPQSASNADSTTSAPTTPKKANNSLVLFFRKELKRKIWTCLEHSIIHQTQLLSDRHLDQILMCAVYVICKECDLSPLPAGRGDAGYSPVGQRVSERHQLYVKPLTTPPPSNHHLTYRERHQASERWQRRSGETIALRRRRRGQETAGAHERSTGHLADSSRAGHP